MLVTMASLSFTVGALTAVVVPLAAVTTPARLERHASGCVVLAVALLDSAVVDAVKC